MWTAGVNDEWSSNLGVGGMYSTTGRQLVGGLVVTEAWRWRNVALEQLVAGRLHV